MISDFVDEREGFLRLTYEQYEQAKVNYPSIRLQARELLEYGEGKEGYWTSEKWNKLSRSLTQSIPEAKDGGVFGSLITVAATHVYPMTRWMSTR